MPPTTRPRPPRTARRRTVAARAPARGRRPDRSAGALGRSAGHRLRHFRRRTSLAIAVTGLLLMVWGVPGSEASGQDAAQAGDTVTDTATAAAMPLPADTTSADPVRSVQEAAGTLRRLVRDAWGILPKVGIALALVLIAGLLARLLRTTLRRTLGSWERADAAAALGSVMIWLIALGAGRCRHSSRGWEAGPTSTARSRAAEPRPRLRP